MITERRKYHDTSARCTYAPQAMTCELKRVGSLDYDAMLRFGWEVLDVAGDCALMRAPKGWNPEEMAL